MLRAGGADKLIVGHIHTVPNLADLRGNPVDIRLRRDALACAICSIFWPCSSEPVRNHVKPHHALVPGDQIGEHDVIGIADMRLTRRIRDGGGDIDCMDVTYDQFIRTTSPQHERVVQKIFKKLYDQGDIYKDTYEGKYCVPCESFNRNTPFKRSSGHAQVIETGFQEIIDHLAAPGVRLEKFRVFFVVPEQTVLIFAQPEKYASSLASTTSRRNPGTCRP